MEMVPPGAELRKVNIARSHDILRAIKWRDISLIRACNADAL
jgi:hypothetical protein